MIRRPPRSTLDRSSAASDVYKRQVYEYEILASDPDAEALTYVLYQAPAGMTVNAATGVVPVSYTHLRAHETVLDLVCRLLLEKKKK